ncbi:MAG TPA: UDP-3-O-acyl-N-acetylglucosamine deacetylase, partial [Bdellovibrionota bacterium]|nr:UDP-3-O-acyl-N-acetylglucosamine deacetylase [Bdellovibrionota bacterium]
MYQNTLARPVQIEGIGLHCGKISKLTLLPAAPHYGIRFVRTDIPEQPEFPASVDFVTSTFFATTIGIDHVQVSTVEHLLSALSGLNVSNVRIEIEGEEIPILDGSAYPFVARILDAGILTQAVRKNEFIIKRPISLIDGNKCAHLLPSDGFRITSTIDFNNPCIGKQTLDLILTPESFCKEIARARTFGFLRDVELMRKNGLAMGGSLENVIVVGPEKVLNPDGLRYPDEFVRHKVLDAIGDLSLLGFPIRGHLITERGGHDLHHQLLNQVLQETESWEISVPLYESQPKAAS